MQLSKRQREVACLIASGETTIAAALTLKVSPKTVEYHRAKIYRLWEINNPVDLTHRVLAFGWIPNKYQWGIVTPRRQDAKTAHYGHD